YPAWRDAIAEAESSGAAAPGEPRSYPGYPRRPLPAVRPALWPSLERTLTRRRCVRSLATVLPDQRTLARLLRFSHGSGNPVPSAGALQALELYLATWEPSWLPAGLHHYDRAGHHLSQLSPDADRAEWRTFVPSLDHVSGGALLWIVVGDGARAAAKYG